MIDAKTALLVTSFLNSIPEQNSSTNNNSEYSCYDHYDCLWRLLVGARKSLKKRVLIEVGLSQVTGIFTVDIEVNGNSSLTISSGSFGSRILE